MRMLASAAVLTVLALAGSRTTGAPKTNPAEDIVFPLPTEEVAAGKFEEWQREAATTTSAITYTSVEYDQQIYWVAEARLGFGDPSSKVAVYAPTRDGSFRRCLLVGPIKAGKFAVAADAKTGLLTVIEEVRSGTKGEVVLSCSLKAVGILP
jgi:hypothetical protein